MADVYTRMNVTFEVVGTGGSYQLTLTPPYLSPSVGPVTLSLEFSANSTVIASRIQTSSLAMAMAVQQVVRTSTASGFTLYIQMLGNMTAYIGSTTAPAVLNVMGIVPTPPTTSVLPTIIPMTTPVSPYALNANSPCCAYLPTMEAQCAGYDFKNASSPAYVLPFPVDMDNSAFGSFVKKYHDTCPREITEMSIMFAPL